MAEEAILSLLALYITTLLYNVCSVHRGVFSTSGDTMKYKVAMGYSRKYPHTPPWTTLEIL